MTQEAFKAWWYNEGSQAPYTHHDCEEHTMRMCEIAWANGAYKALAEHAMQEVQRLGQEIEQEPVAWLDEYGNAFPLAAKQYSVVGKHWKPLYTTTPQRTWVGLTEQDLDYLCNLAYTGDEEFALAVQAKLMEKNA